MLVGNHGAPNVVSEASLQTPSRFAGCLALGDLRVIVGAASAARGSDLSDSDGVQCGVELSVSAARQTVSRFFGTGDLDRRGAGVVGEGSRAGESVSTTGAPDEAPGCDRPDANDVGQ